MRRATVHRATSEGGTTLLELMVALAIVSLALGVAASLMLEAQKRSYAETNRIVETSIPIALRQIEVDVTAAVSGSGSSEHGEPMTLHWPSGVRVVYELSGTRLLRRLSQPAGERLVLDGVESFAWTWFGGEKPLAVIEVGLGGAESYTLELTMRGGGGVGW